MTSVASFDGATTAGNFTLVFSGVRIPSSAWIPGVNGWVETFRSEPSRLTPIARRQNFTAPNIILDGRFPAQVWDHEFVLYTETGSLGQFAEVLFKLQDEIRDLPVDLRIEDGDTGDVIFEFGPCYINAPASLEEPSELLMFRAGFIRISFVGSTRPIVNDLP